MSKGNEILNILVDGYGLAIGGPAQGILAVRFDNLLDSGASIGNTAILGPLAFTSPGHSITFNDITEIRDDNPDLFEPGESVYDVVTMYELENYDSDNPFDAGDGAFRFEFDASIRIETAIKNFSDDDTLYFDNSPTQSEDDFNVTQDDYDDGKAVIDVAHNQITLLGLEDDYFWHADSFKAIYGDDALVFA